MTEQEIRRFYQRQWRAKHPERREEWARRAAEWNKANPEKYAATQKAHREERYKSRKTWPNKWVSVNDFLPDKGVPVLAYIRHTEEYFPGEDYGVLTWDGETWSGGDWNDAPVTHWARLPGPPKKEEDEDGGTVHTDIP